jgi:hypothetical protein
MLQFFFQKRLDQHFSKKLDQHFLKKLHQHFFGGKVGSNIFQNSYTISFEKNQQFSASSSARSGRWVRVGGRWRDTHGEAGVRVHG